jgi:DNA ligase-associated metallophosphoesterase
VQTLRSNQTIVAPDLLLDGRLALFHRREKWLAIADLHFGYELSQRAAGRLTPLWGMATARERLLQLLREYLPERLVIVGDVVHDRAGAASAAKFLKELEEVCAVTLIAGNHDREIGRRFQTVNSWSSSEFLFHHGHCAAADPGARIQIIGHHHPAGVLHDGAGLRLKCPAFVQQERCWIMPAFSPWAAGASWPKEDADRVWLCTPKRVLAL